MWNDPYIITIFINIQESLPVSPALVKTMANVVTQIRVSPVAARKGGVEISVIKVRSVRK